MKKLFLLIVFAGSICTTSFAQNHRAEWLTIKTPNLRCWECKQRMEDYMAREVSQTEGGVIKMQINLLSGTTRVQYWPDRVNVDYIKTIFANAGFDADDMKATEDFIKNYPQPANEMKKVEARKKASPATCNRFKKS